MPIYKVKLKCKREIAAETMAFHFEKPEGFAYKAGQSADCTLITTPLKLTLKATHERFLWRAPLTKIILCWRHGCVTLRSSGY
jgi:hypothetical protein